MQVSPRLLGAGAAVLLAGIASGAVIGKVPPMKHLAPGYLLPQSGGGELAWTPPSALPDHYPIVTPEGRFEVYQLANRGLYRQARYAEAYYPVDYYPEDYAAFEDGYADEAGGWADTLVAPAAEPAVIAAAPETTPPARLVPPAPEQADEDSASAAPAMSVIEVADAAVAQY